MTDKEELDVTARLNRLIGMMNKAQKQKLLAYGEVLITERRLAERKKHTAEINYASTERSGSGFIKNISLFGVYIEPESVLETGRSVTLSFPHPFLGKQIKITGKIIRKDKKGFAVKFSKSIGNM